MWSMILPSLLSLLSQAPAAQAPEGPTHVLELGNERLRHAGRVVTLAHDPVGGTLASTSTSGEVAVWDPASGEALASFRFPESHVSFLGYLAPDRLLLGMRDDHLVVLDRSEGDLVVRDPFEVGLGDLASVGGGLSVGPSGARALVWPLTGVGGALLLADLESGGRTPVEFPGFSAIRGAWSPEGDRVAVLLTNPLKTLGRRDTADQDSSRILVLDCVTGEVLARIDSATEYLRSVAWGPGEGDEALIVAGGDEGLHLFEVDGGRELARFGAVPEARLIDLVAVEGGTLVAASNPSGRLEVWSVSADEAPAAQIELDLERPLVSLSLAPSGTHLVVAEGQAMTRQTLPGLEPDPLLLGHTGALGSLACAGERLVSCSLDGTLLVWDEERPRSLSRHHEGLVFGADLAPGGELLATCGQDGTVRVRSLADEDFGAELFMRRTSSAAGFMAVGFDPAGERLAAVSADGILWIWGLEEGLLLRTFEGLAGLQFRLAWSADGSRLAVGSSGVRVWDTTSWEQVGQLADLGSPVTSLAFGGAADRLGIGLAGRAVQLRRVEDGERLEVWTGLPNRVEALDWWPGRGFVATARGAGGALLLGEERGEPVLLESPRGADAVVLSSASGGRFAVGDSRGFVHLWE